MQKAGGWSRENTAREERSVREGDKTKIVIWTGRAAGNDTEARREAVR